MSKEERKEFAKQIPSPLLSQFTSKTCYNITMSTKRLKSSKNTKSKPLYVAFSSMFALVVACGLIVYANLATRQSTPPFDSSDAVQFSSEYTEVPADNLFNYRSADEIINILEHGTGIVFLGFPECQWCQAYAPMLNQAAKDNGLEKIYYYNILEDRQNNTATYQKLVKLLSGQLQFDDEGRERIYVPHVAFVRGGQIVASDYETSKDTAGAKVPSDYWNAERIASLKARLNDDIQLIKEAGCETTCDK